VCEVRGWWDDGCGGVGESGGRLWVGHVVSLGWCWCGGVFGNYRGIMARGKMEVCVSYTPDMKG
jgi:hypothetical protein